MKKPTSFDVLIVYSAANTTSASSKNLGITTPFKKKCTKYNDVYAYFLQSCAAQNIKAAFTTTNDITGSGECKSYWLFKQNEWVKVNKACFAPLIFDKFFPITFLRQFERDMMFASGASKSFTNTHLYKLFFDKFETYSKLKVFSVPTVTIEGKKLKDVRFALASLQEKINLHPNKNDFIKNVILKDRYGAGGYNIHKIDSDFVKNIYNLVKKNEKLSFIIQPFVAFKNGYTYKDYSGATEIRLIYLGKRVVQTYIRVAGNKDFRCNHGQGGIWITEEDIPARVLKTATKIASKLNKSSALFALDFIVSNNNNVYLLEGNISPGLDWYTAYPDNEKMNKHMIDVIVGELLRRTLISSSARTIINNDEKAVLKPRTYSRVFPISTLLPHQVL